LFEYRSSYHSLVKIKEHLFRAAAKGEKGDADSRGHGHLWGPCDLVSGIFSLMSPK